MSTQHTKNYFNIKLNQADIIFCLDDIRFVDLRCKDEQPSIKGIYIEYYDGKDLYVHASDISENAKIESEFLDLKTALIMQDV